MRLQSRSQRRGARLLVNFWRPGKAVEYGEGRVANLSPSGVFISTRDPLPPPSQVILSFVLGEEAIEIRGEVVRSMGGGANQHSATSGMGVRFSEPESEAVERLLSYRSGSGAPPEEGEGQPPETTGETESPITESPGTESPRTESPGTESPRTESPETESPETVAPQRVGSEKIGSERATTSGGETGSAPVDIRSPRED